MRLSLPACSLLLSVFTFWGIPQIASATPLDFQGPPDFQDLFTQLDGNGDGWLQANEIDDKNARLFTRLLRSADADGDRQLSAAEFGRGLQPHRVAKPLPKKQGGKLPGSDALLLLLARMNINGDQTITADEVPEEFRGFFKQMQTKIGGEQDGLITQREIARLSPQLSQVALRYAMQHEIDVELEIALLPAKQWSMVKRMDTPYRAVDMLSGPEQAKEIFARLDQDGNGQVTTEEVPPPFADRFAQLLKKGDKNRDGQLSKKEMMTLSRRMEAQKKQRPSQAEIERRLERVLRQFDRNGDNLLSSKEVPRRMTARFGRLDVDSNGTLDRQELKRVVELLNPVRKPEVKGTTRRRSRKKK